MNLPVFLVAGLGGMVAASAASYPLYRRLPARVSGEWPAAGILAEKWRRAAPRQAEATEPALT